MYHVESKFSVEIIVPGELCHTRKQRAEFVREQLKHILDLPDCTLGAPKCVIGNIGAIKWEQRPKNTDVPWYPSIVD
jgi:hypothetical protein